MNDYMKLLERINAHAACFMPTENTAAMLCDNLSTIRAALSLAADAERIKKASFHLRDDIMRRAKRDGEAKVAVSVNAAWLRFCQALQGEA